MVPCCRAFLLQVSSEAGRTLIKQSLLQAQSHFNTCALWPANKNGCHAHAEDCPEIGFHDDTFCSEAQRSHADTAVILVGACPRRSLFKQQPFFNTLPLAYCAPVQSCWQGPCGQWHCTCHSCRLRFRLRWFIPRHAVVCGKIRIQY